MNCARALKIHQDLDIMYRLFPCKCLEIMLVEERQVLLRGPNCSTLSTGSHLLAWLKTYHGTKLHKKLEGIFE